ncbi:MAG: virion core protein, partial [Hungatella sp.]
RGIEVQSVGLGSISYDEESQKLINMRNQGAMLSDPGVREGYVQGSIARGMEAAGSNANGSMAGFMGMGVGMNATGGFMGAASNNNMQQMQMNQAQMNQTQMNQAQMNQAAGQTPAAVQAAAPTAGWTCACGHVNTGRFCSECGSPKPTDGSWTCTCGTVNMGKFCSQCGKPRA